MTVPVDLNVERVHEISPADNRAAVCVVLRWAARSRVGEPAARVLCEVLGLDLDRVVHRRVAAQDPAAPGITPQEHPPTERGGPLARQLRQWLHAYLVKEGGAATVAEITKAVQSEGISVSMSTLRAARDAIGAISTYRGRAWTWQLGGDEGRSAPSISERCGTYAGYQVHRRQGTEPCQPCRMANSRRCRAR